MYLDDRQQAWGYEDSPSLTTPVAEPFRAGRYVILQHVGHGAMGNVYAAYDPDLDRKVAVKVLRDGGRPLPASLAREAKAMAKLTHPHVVAVHDVGTCDRGVFVAMEFVEGVTLRTWLKGQQRSWREILGVFRRAGEGLAAAHAGGVVHHDFKPDNVLIGKDGAVVKVVDFGLARVALGTAAAVSGELSDAGARATTTSATAISGSLRSGDPTQASERGPVGTLAYMAPERHALRPADARSDQFSFCVALYEALYHQRPFAGSDVASLRQSVLHGAPQDPPKGPVPSRVAAALRRGLARAPEDRFPTMTALLAALAEPRRRMHWVLSAGLVIAGSAAMLAAQRSEDRCEAATTEADAWWLAHAGEVPAEVAERHAAWRGRVAATCEAGHRGEVAPDLRLAREACLTEQWALTRALVETAMKVPDQSAALWAEVPTGEVCDDPAVLVAVPAPAFEQRGEVAEIREGLAQVAADEVAGAYAPARAQVAALLTRAEALGYAPVVAEAMYQRGRLEHYSGESARAADSLMAAIDLAEANRHDRLAADAWGFAAEVAALSGRREFADWHRRALAASARLTAGSRDEIAASGGQQVHAAMARGLGALQAGDRAAAAAAFRAALDEPRLHPLMRGKLQINLAVALDGEAKEAAWIAALAAYEDPRITAPHRAMARIERGESLFWLERYTEAGEAFAAGAALLAAQPEPTKQRQAALRMAYRGIAIAEVIAFDVPAADRAIAAAEQAGRDGALPADAGLMEVAFEVKLLADRPDEARRIAEDALALVRAQGAAPADRAMAHARVGEALLWSGEDAAAVQAFTAALAVVDEAALPQPDDTAAYAYKGLGLRALRAGALKEATRSLEQATALWQATPCDCRDEAEAQLALAAVYERQGDARGPALRAAGEQFFARHGAGAEGHRGRLARWIGGS